jgi:hypothetical protein
MRQFKRTVKLHWALITSQPLISLRQPGAIPCVVMNGSQRLSQVVSLLAETATDQGISFLANAL